MVNSSFFVDGEVYDTGVVTSNDTPASTTPSQAPSGFFPGGTVYSETDPDVAANYATQAAASAAQAASSASAASTSASSAAGAAAAAATAAVAGAAGTATPIVDGTATVGTSAKWAHEDHIHPTDTSRASVTALGLKADKTYVDTQDATKADKTYVDTQDATKAPTANPTFTGTVTIPTPTAGDNSTKAASTAFVQTALGSSSSGHGQCVLTLSGGSLLLKPKNGNKLIVNGAACTIPDAGVTLAATGLTAGTTYLIYATASAGVVNGLEASTTAHAASTTAGNKGVEIKSGDDTRSLVGMARPITGPAWADTLTQRFVISWFNRGTKGLQNHFTATRSTTSVSFVEMHSEVRCEFLTWGDEAVVAAAACSGYATAASTANYVALAFDDGTSPEDGMFAFSDTATTVSTLKPCPAVSAKVLSEGYHFCTVAGAVDSGGGLNIYVQSATNGKRSGLGVTIRG